MDRKNTNQAGWPVTAAMAAAEEAEANAAVEQAAANGVAVYSPANHASHQTQVPGRLPSMTVLRYPPGFASVVPVSSVPPGLVALPADYSPLRPINMASQYPLPGLNNGQSIAGRPRGPSQPTSFPGRNGNNSNLYPVYEEPASGYSDTFSVQEQAPVANNTPPGSEMDCGVTDILANPYLTPSPGRRGRDHIEDVLNRIDNVKLTPSPQRQPVPWRKQTKVINPKTEAAPAQQFVPMRTVQEKRAQRRATGSRIPGANGMLPPSPPEPEPEPSNLRKKLCVMNGFSVNYKGDIGNAANRSANISDNLNCSLWIVGLYAGITMSRLLHGVTLVGPTGKIFATVISDAQPDKGHNGAAAKIVFFDRVGAERLKAAIEAQRLDNIIGRRVRVSFNRIRSAPQNPSNLSRVMLIWGPRELVNHLRLHALFKDRVEYQTEAVVIHEDNANGAVIEWRFGSYRNQASAVNTYLSVEHNMSLRWMFADDPCATGKYYPGGMDVTRDITKC